MATWGTYGTALVRAGIQAIPLPGDEVQAALAALEEHHSGVVSHTAPILEQRSGRGAPARDLSASVAQELDRLAVAAWHGLPDSEQKDLRTLAKLLAKESNPNERISLVYELSGRLARQLLEHRPLHERVMSDAGDASAQTYPATLPPGVYPPTLEGGISPTLRDSSSGLGVVPAEEAPLVTKGRLLVCGLLASCMFLFACGLSSILWGPPLYRFIRFKMRDPEQVRRVEQTKAEVEQLKRSFARVASALELRQSAALRDTGEQIQRAEAAFAEDDLQTALAEYERARDAYRGVLQAEARKRKLKAEEALRGWEPLARAFKLRAPPELHSAREEVSRADSLASSGKEGEAALVYHKVPELYRAALLRADRKPPELVVSAPAENLRTTDGTVRLEGSLRDMSFAGLEVAGRPVEAKPGGDVGKYAFSLELPLPRLGSHVFQVRAWDATGQETVVRRRVEREPIPLRIELESPREGTITRAPSVVVRGRVSGKVPATSVAVNGRSARLEGDRFTFHLSPGEGGLTVNIVARGAFAEGKASRQVIVDRTAPRLSVSGVNNYGTVYTDRLRLGVSAQDSSPTVRVSVAGQTKEVRQGSSGYFYVALRPGLNTIRVRGVDTAGNVAEVVRRVTRRTDPKQLAPFRVGVRRYRITRDVVVNASERLVLKAGSHLEFLRGVGMTVNGKLEVNGSRWSKVTFTGSSWRGLTIRGSSARAVLQWAVIQGAHKPTSGGGIALQSGAYLKLVDSVVSGCRSDKLGGGLMVIGGAARSSQAECVNVTFSRNTAKEGGGLNANNYARVTLRRCVFSDNTASLYGGGLVGIGRKTARTQVNGFTLRFERNKAKWGGGVNVANGAHLELSGGSFKSNTAERGGGLYLKGAQNDLATSKCSAVTFESNSSDEGGGVNVSSDARGRFVDCVFRYNRAKRYGGGIISVAGVPRLSEVNCVRTRFERNTAGRDGGGVNVNRYSSGSFERCTFIRNTATNWGGGLMAIGRGKKTTTGPSTRLSINRCTFTSNTSTARQGPDLCVHRDAIFSRSQLSTSGLWSSSRYYIWGSR